jgi:hypothetical protein
MEKSSLKNAYLTSNPDPEPNLNVMAEPDPKK